MPKKIIVSGKEVIITLQKVGFIKVRQKGSHVHLIKNKFHVTVPIHGNKDLPPFIIHSIARQSGYSMKEFVALF